MIPDVKKRELEICVRAVCKMTGLPEGQIYHPTRKAGIATVRFLVWYGLRIRFRWNLREIAMAFDKDHTTVMNGIWRAKISHWTGQVLEAIEAEVSTYPLP